MSDVVIKVENLWKEYRLGVVNHGTLKRDLQSWWARVRGHDDPNTRIDVNGAGRQSSTAPEAPDRFWALRDVSFDVRQGEVLGIIGRNGAGKSTLLKILSRVTTPTKGEVKIRGRVASLLEVGTGFHPELTGRENIFLNGAILGMSKAEIRAKFDEIVDFSGVEKFIDTPVKRYSSGMYVRLAFAVAAHLDPEILIIDEVLAVGDAEFQKKCLGKMGEVAKGGRTVLFVSHNMTALKSLCSTGMWLNGGKVMQMGEAGEVVSNYLQYGAQEVAEQVWADFASAPGSEYVRFKRVALIPEGAEGVIDVTTSLGMEFEIWNRGPDLKLNFSLHLYNQEGLCILNTGSLAFECAQGVAKGRCKFPGDFFNDEVYRVMIMLVRDRSVGLYSLHDALVFEVRDIERQGTAWFGKWPGLVRPRLEWTTEVIPEIVPVRS